MDVVAFECKKTNSDLKKSSMYNAILITFMHLTQRNNIKILHYQKWGKTLNTGCSSTYEDDKYHQRQS